MSDIFISYSSKDRARAKVLAGALERQGWSVWWDRKIPPGRQFSQVIKEAMDEAKCIIVLWSKESVKSDWVQNEASEGARRKILVPMLIDDVEIPFEFRRIQAARLVDWEGRSPHPEFDTLLEALCAILGQPLLPQASEPIPDEQQPGLETEKAWSKSRMAKVLAAICIVTLITIISIGVFFNKERDRPPVDKPQGVPAKKLAPEPTEEDNIVTNSIGMKLVYIPAGSFMMGSSRSAAQLAREYETREERFADEFPQHQVRISEGFWMGQTEVTQGQYKSVMNAQPWSGEKYVQEDANNPAVYVSWEDAATFCRKLSQQESETYRLPTEAEWEYACRAGTTTRFSFGDSDSSLGDHAWFRDNTWEVGQEYAHSVGQKEPNPWGLYDMHGNVWEWCSDYYGKDYYYKSPIVDPNGPSSGPSRSLRGGSSGLTMNALRCSYRPDYVSSDGSDSSVGFRVVRSQ